MSGDHPRTRKIIVKLVKIRLCEMCLRGEGKVCHVPECALHFHNVPGPMPIMPELYEVLEEIESS